MSQLSSLGPKGGPGKCNPGPETVIADSPNMTLPSLLGSQKAMLLRDIHIAWNAGVSTLKPFPLSGALPSRLFWRSL